MTSFCAAYLIFLVPWIAWSIWAYVSCFQLWDSFRCSVFSQNCILYLMGHFKLHLLDSFSVCSILISWGNNFFNFRNLSRLSTPNFTMNQSCTCFFRGEVSNRCCKLSVFFLLLHRLKLSSFMLLFFTWSWNSPP